LKAICGGTEAELLFTAVRSNWLTCRRGGPAASCRMDSGVPAQMLMGCFDRVPLEIALDVRAGQRTSLPVRRSGGTGLGCRRVPLLLVVTEGSAGEGVLRVEAVCNCKHCELCANVPFRRVGCPFTRLVRQFCGDVY
jgi:hypothetical protein